jgi:hypothetical protein
MLKAINPQLQMQKPCQLVFFIDINGLFQLCGGKYGAMRGVE